MSDEVDNMSLEQLQDVARLHRKMFAGEAREDALKAYKKVTGANVVELDIPAKIQETQIKPLQEQIEKMQAEAMERNAKENVEKARAQIKEANKLSETDMVEVEKFALENKIGDYSAAAKLFKMANQHATPTSPNLTSRPTVDMPSGDWQKGLGNKRELDKVARDMAFKVWNEETLGRAS
jgi:TolA-binding protein